MILGIPVRSLRASSSCSLAHLPIPRLGRPYAGWFLCETNQHILMGISPRQGPTAKLRPEALCAHRTTTLCHVP